jgi:hypothetical protein
MDKGGFCWSWKRFNGLSVYGTCFYNCQQKQNVTRSWHKWTIFGLSLRGCQFETRLERWSSEFTIWSLVWLYALFEFYKQFFVFFLFCSSFPFLPLFNNVLHKGLLVVRESEGLITYLWEVAVYAVSSSACRL